MNCELAHERIVTAAYGELPDEQMHELERHVTGCAECQKEREQVLALKVLADAHPVAEPDPNLVARARLRLDEALDTLPPKRWYERLGERILNNFASLQAAPVAALLLLVAAPERVFWAATSTRRAGRRMRRRRKPPPRRPSCNRRSAARIGQRSRHLRHRAPAQQRDCRRELQPACSASDRGLARRPGRSASCSCWPVENSASPGVRDDSVALLAAECRAGHSCQPAGIRDALMVALRYDKSAKVREKALEGLEPYVAEDVRVRDAVLEACSMTTTRPSAPPPSICWSLSRPIPASARCSIRSPTRTIIPRSGMFPGRS